MAPAERKLSIFFPSLSPVLEPLSVGNSKNTPPKSDIHGPSTLDGGSTPNTNHSHPATPRKDTLDTPKMAKNKGAKAKNSKCSSALHRDNESEMRALLASYLLPMNTSPSRLATIGMRKGQHANSTK